MISFDDNYVSNALEPELTTVRMPLYDMGVCAAEFLISSKIELDVVLGSSLIVRKSVSYEGMNN